LSGDPEAAICIILAFWGKLVKVRTLLPRPVILTDKNGIQEAIQR
jgi:hypothetical protein